MHNVTIESYDKSQSFVYHAHHACLLCGRPVWRGIETGLGRAKRLGLFLLLVRGGSRKLCGKLGWVRWEVMQRIGHRDVHRNVMRGSYLRRWGWESWGFVQRDGKTGCPGALRDVNVRRGSCFRRCLVERGGSNVKSWNWGCL